MFNRRIIFIFFLLIAAIATLSLVSAGDSSHDIVNASLDEVETDSSIDAAEPVSEDNSDDVLGIENEDDVLDASKKGTFTELQNKIDKASKGSTIYLDKDYQYDDGFGTENGIRITKSITIDGKGHAINGLENSALLLINKANNVVLKNIVFKNGQIYGVGNVAVFQSNNIKFVNCIFKDNCANVGAAVYLYRSDYSSFVGCVFSNNEAEYDGGAVYFDSCRNPSFVDCSFNDNFAMYVDFVTRGGAVYLSSCSNPSFSNCDFDWNSAYYGGVVYLSSCSGASFSDCLFKNDFSSRGGAIYLDSCDGSSFSGCKFDMTSAIDSDFENYGGAFYLDSSTDSSFVDCIFDFNLADYGGSIYSKYSSSSFDSCTFTYCFSTVNGGAISAVQSTLNLLNTKFILNEAYMGGGDISSKYGMIVLSNSSFYNSSSSFGGSLSFNDDYVQINDCTFENSASIDNAGGAVYCSNSIVNCFSSRFMNCFAYYSGGAICSLNCELNLRNNYFDHSRSSIGGSIYTLYGSLMLDNSTFLFSHGRDGGAVFIRSPRIIYNITDNRFLYSAAEVCHNIYVEGYYGEIPESGNICEDIFFVLADFNYDCDGTSYCGYSNVLAYVFSNSNEYQNNLSFYNQVVEEFISSIDDIFSEYGSNVRFTIYDEDNPENSIIFSNYDSDESRVIYDVGQSYGESPMLNVYFCNREGFVLNNLHIMPSGSFDVGIGGNFFNITFFSDMFNCEGVYMQPDYDEDMTVFNGSVHFNFNENYIYCNFGNLYDYSMSYNPIPLFNPNYALTEAPNDYYYYDSGNLGYVTPVKNQDIGSNCWAFAGIATLEACLKKMTGEDYDLSENHAKNIMASSSVYGLNLDPNGGGYDSMFIGYLASWLGPVNESDDKYNPLSSVSLEFKPLFHVLNVMFLSPRQNGEDNDEFKLAIMKYGAVAAIFDWTTKEVSKGYHAVSIVGWDDEYNDYDSLGNYAHGVWIFKNSWGDEWGEGVGGYGFLSYDQNLSGEIAPYMHAYTFVFNDGDVGYQQNYQYDFAGLSDYVCADGDGVYYKNKFVARNDEFLYAFSTYFEKPTNFTFSVRINGKEITETEDNVPISNSTHYSPAGYHTIPLGYNLTLNEGDEFEIIIKLVNEGINYVPICQADELYTLSYPSNVSFLSYNGQDWIDLYDLEDYTHFAYGGIRSNTCQVACIKAFTAGWRGDASTSIILDKNAMKSPYNTYKLDIDSFSNVLIPSDVSIEMVLEDWDYDNEEYENYIEVLLNDEVHYLKVRNGTAVLNIHLVEESYYRFSAKLKSNYYTSNLVEFEFIAVKNSNFKTFNELEEIIDKASEGSVIALNNDYYCDVNFNESYILINKSLTIDGRGHALNGLSKSGIFKIAPGCNVTLKNITFKNGNSVSEFSTIFSSGNLTVSNCTFTKNKCNKCGGAIYSQGECYIADSVFDSNYALYGGAIYVLNSNCSIDNTAFNRNVAYSGGSIYVDGFSKLNIKNSDFTYDWALGYGGSIYSCNILNITNSNFISSQNIEVIGFQYHYDDNNVAHGELYLKNNKITTNAAAVYYNENEIPYDSSLQLIFSNVKAIKGQYVTLFKIVDEDGITFNFVDVNVTLVNKKNPSSAVSLKISYNRILGGYVLDTSSFDYGVYKLTGNLSNLYASDCIVKDGTLYIVKKSVLKTSSLRKTYGENKKLTFTLKDGKGKAISNVYVKVKLNGKVIKVKTNSKGKASIDVKLAPKTYTATITFAGNDKYYSAKATAKVVIKKAKPKITAKKKTFKLKTKVKKYTITLKNNLGKAMKNTKVTLKVKGKTYTAKTNGKGKATFKIKNLKKKGTFTATVKFKANKYYKAVTKKVKITVKK